MAEAVIVSTARTPIGRAFRGSFNMTYGATLTGHVIQHAVERAKLEPGEIEDVVIGGGFTEATTGNKIARPAALRAGRPGRVDATLHNLFSLLTLNAPMSDVNR